MDLDEIIREEEEMVKGVIKLILAMIPINFLNPQV